MNKPVMLHAEQARRNGEIHGHFQGTIDEISHMLAGLMKEEVFEFAIYKAVAIHSQQVTERIKAGESRLRLLKKYPSASKVTDWVAKAAEYDIMKSIGRARRYRKG